MTRVRIVISYPNPWWRRLLRLPRRPEVRGPFEVKPWPASWNDEEPPRRP